MVKEDNTRDRVDGGRVEARDIFEEAYREQDHLPALGLIAQDDFGVLHNLVNAAEMGIETYLIDTEETHPAIARIARHLNTTVISPPIENPGDKDLHNVLSTYARANSSSGVIIPEDSATPLNLERTIEHHDGDSFRVEAITEKKALAPEVLVAIPAFNEAATIEQVVQTACSYANTVIVVDDGSTDETAKLARSAGAEVIEHEANLGYGSALSTAFTEAAERDADHLVILDGDGQHDPRDIPRAVNIQKERGADIVIGSRFAESSETELPFYRRFGIEVVNILTNLSMGVVRPQSWVRDTQSGFRTYNKRAIQSLSENGKIGDGMSASTDIVHYAHRQDYDFEEFGTNIEYDVVNASSRHPVSHGVALIMNLLRTVEHERPVTVLGIPGFVSTLVGFGFGYWTFANYISSGTFSVGLAVASVFFALAGIFACFTAIILHSLNTHLK